VPPAIGTAMDAGRTCKRFGHSGKGALAGAAFRAVVHRARCGRGSGVRATPHPAGRGSGRFRPASSAGRAGVLGAARARLGGKKTRTPADLVATTAWTSPSVGQCHDRTGVLRTLHAASIPRVALDRASSRPAGFVRAYRGLLSSQASRCRVRCAVVLTGARTLDQALLVRLAQKCLGRGRAFRRSPPPLADSLQPVCQSNRRNGRIALNICRASDSDVGRGPGSPGSPRASSPRL
jgi:hypothetical protein